jgi:hypothetical protein
VDYGLIGRPGSLPGASYLAGISNATFMTYLSCTGYILLLTPTGSLPSPRWRWWAWVAAVAAVALRDSMVLAALGVCVALLPLATGAAILRDRLYDLDRIISRTFALLSDAPVTQVGDVRYS